MMLMQGKCNYFFFGQLAMHLSWEWMKQNRKSNPVLVAATDLAVAVAAAGIANKSL